MKKRAFIFPVSGRMKSAVYNPYMDNFIKATSFFVDYLNTNSPSNQGVFNLIKYIGKVDFLFLNWIENIPDRKGGYLQTVFFLMILKLKKLLGLKIVWTLHNKISHSPDNLKLKTQLFRAMLKQSDLIITHSNEGIRFAESMHKGASTRIFYFPHPIILSRHFNTKLPLQNDLLIWGTITPYKGIDSFLEYLYQQNEQFKYKILIVGKVPSNEFLDKLKEFENEKIIINNQYIDNEELSVMINSSKAVLFTYTGDSVLSSGALMDSLAHGALVIGPHVGAFKDSSDLGVIKTYQNFDQLMSILHELDDAKKAIDHQKISDFTSNYSWENFGHQLNEVMKDLK
jgi:beta-1,4-mannosyltransferase